MTRRELVILAILVAAGVALRLVAWSQSAVEHFDEGVYASNLWFGPPDYAYPLRHLYAPPLLPALIEAGMIAGLAPNLAALLPSFMAGSATIVAFWWFGRTWFSPAVGLAAAALCAFSDFHILYSTAALTDALLGLWIVLAVQAIGMAYLRGDLRWAVVGGLFTGLAWWTKYNGWLPLAIGATALPLFVLMTKWTNVKSPNKSLRLPTLRMLALCLVVAAATAAIVWLPYVVSLKSQGGYAPIAANHARYIVGLSGWSDGLSRHVASQQYVEGIASWISVAVAAALPAIMLRRDESAWRGWVWYALASIVALLLAAVGTSFVFVIVAAPLGLVASAVGWSRMPEADEAVRRRQVGLALLTAWYCGLALATPCYWPYPRLLVPWLLTAWIGAAVLLDELARHFLAMEPKRVVWRLPSVTAGVLGLAALVALYHHTRLTHQGFQRESRLNLLAACRELIADLGPSSQPRVIYVLGEPAVLFQLRAAGEPLVVPLQGIPTEPARDAGQPIATYLVLGPHSLGGAQRNHSQGAALAGWNLIAGHEYRPSLLVALDLYDPRHSDLGEQRQRNQVTLYRLTTDR
jgi:dolichyl-phosphate-mannose-protein mannosyltransferase